MMKLLLDLQTERELLEELFYEVQSLGLRRRCELSEQLFENSELGKNWAMCYAAALRRLVQIKYGDIAPNEPGRVVLGMGSEHELRAEVPSKTRCRTD